MSAAASQVTTEIYMGGAIDAAIARHTGASTTDGGRFRVKDLKASGGPEAFMVKIHQNCHDAFLSDCKQFEEGSLHPPSFSSWTAVVAEFERFLLWRVSENTSIIKTKKKGGSTCMMRFNFTGYSPSETEVSKLVARIQNGDLADFIKRIGQTHCSTHSLGASYYSESLPMASKKGAVITKAALNQITFLIGCVVV